MGEFASSLPSQSGEPRVVIVGGGFAGLHAAIALAHLPVAVTLLDRRNHHTFQPLLYQVALAVLSPAEIAAAKARLLAGRRSLDARQAHSLEVERAELFLDLDPTIDSAAASSRWD